LRVHDVASGKDVTERPENYMYLVYGKEMKIINYGQDFLYIRETYEQLRELSLLVTECSM